MQYIGRLFPLLLLTISLPAGAADLSGGWGGTFMKDSEALPVTVAFEKIGGAYSGSFSSEVLQAAEIPFKEVAEKGDKVHFVLKGDATTTVFDGVVGGDALRGTFTEGAAKGTFTLTRVAPMSATIKSRDVTFRDGDITLAGTLVLPSSPGPHPAVMFLHGSGAEGRWANRWLAEKLAEAGIVALISDKRGVGQSTGDWKEAGFDDLAADAVAGVHFLQAQPEVDPNRVGLYGHSQGGTIAPLVVERAGDVAFVVASAPGGLPPSDMETYSVENSIGVPFLPPGEREDAQAFVRAIVDVAYRGHPRSELDAFAAKYESRSWYFDPPPEDDVYWRLSRRIADFEPPAHWRNVRVPVLLLFGAHDERVPSVPSASAIRTTLAREARRAGRKINVTVKFYPDADHTFTIVDPPHKGGWLRHEPDYADTIAHWVTSLR